MRSAFFVVVLVAGGISFAASAGGSTHTVAEGDTLWGLSSRYYQDPWQWKRIWEANRGLVQDPDRIYPAQSLLIPDAAAVAEKAAAESTVPPPQEVPVTPAVETVKAEPASAPQPEAEEPAEEPAAEQTDQEDAAVPETEAPAETEPPAAEEVSADEPAEVAADEPAESETGEPAESVVVLEEPAPVAAAYRAPDRTASPPSIVSAKQDTEPSFYEAESFVAPLSWPVDGYITGDKDRKLLIATGDIVYVNLGDDKVKPGTRCMVYRFMGKSRDPRTREHIGYEVRRIAQVEVTKGIGRDISAAKVITTYDPIEIGDAVKLLSASKQ